MRVLVCGGRDYTDRAALYAELDRLHAAYSFGRSLPAVPVASMRSPSNGRSLSDRRFSPPQSLHNVGPCFIAGQRDQGWRDDRDRKHFPCLGAFQRRRDASCGVTNLTVQRDKTSPHSMKHGVSCDQPSYR